MQQEKILKLENRTSNEDIQKDLINKNHTKIQLNTLDNFIKTNLIKKDISQESTNGLNLTSKNETKRENDITNNFLGKKRVKSLNNSSNKINKSEGAKSLSNQTSFKDTDADKSNTLIDTEKKIDNPTKKSQKTSKLKKNIDHCFICKQGENLLLCNRCPKSFHSKCLNINIIDNNSIWYCNECQIIINKINQRKEDREKRELLKKEKELERELIYKKNKITKKVLSNNNNCDAKKSNSKTKTKKNSKKSNNKNADLLKDNLSKDDNLENTILDCSNLDLVEYSYSYDGNNLLNGPKDVNIDSKTFDELNNLEYIINNVIKSNKVCEYVTSYLNKAEENKIDICSYKPILSINKKKKSSSTVKKPKLASTKKKKSNKSVQSKLNKKLFIKGANLTNKLKINSNSKKSMLALRRIEEQKKRWLEIERKREEKRYANIKFPIEDDELISKIKFYKLEEKYLKKHIAKSILIPDDCFLNIYKIYDFVHTFSNDLKLSIDFSVEMLYLSLNSNDINLSNLVKQIIISLLGVLVDYIMYEEYNINDNISIDHTNTVNNDDNTNNNLNNNDSSMFSDKEFILIKLIFKYTKHRKDKILNFIYLEITKILVFSQKYFQISNSKLKSLIKSICKHNNSDSFFTEILLDDKLLIINFLINCCLELDLIRKTIASDSIKKVELKREKASLENEIKQMEIKKKELEKVEKQINPKDKIDQLNLQLANLTEENNHLNRKDLMKMRKDIENKRDEYKGMIKEIEDIEIKKLKLLAKHEKALNDIFYLTNNSRRCIGKDIYGNSYYIFKGKNNYIRIFVKANNKVKTNNKLFIMNKNSWGMYNDYSSINSLLESLTEKGKNEKNLIDNIKSINIKLISNNEIDPEDNEILLDLTRNWNNTYIIKNINSNINIEVKNNNINDSNTVKIKSFSLINLEIIEKKFSDYLFNQNMQWDLNEIQQEFLAYIKCITTIDQFIKTLDLLNETFKLPLFINNNNNDIINNRSNNKYHNPKIIIDEDENNNYNLNEKPLIIDDYNNLVPNYKEIFIESLNKTSNNYDNNNYVFNYKKSISKINFWKHLSNYELENIFTDRLSSVSTWQEMLFLIVSFYGVISSYIEGSLSRNKKLNKFNKNKFKKDKLSDNNLDVISSLESSNNNDDSYINDDSLVNESTIKNKNKKLSMSTNKINFNDYNSNNNRLITRRQLKELDNNNSLKNNKDSYNNNKSKKKNIEWKDECILCQEGGKIILCETCPNAVHMECVGFDEEPEEYYCDRCQFENNKKRITRSRRYR